VLDDLMHLSRLGSRQTINQTNKQTKETPPKDAKVVAGSKVLLSAASTPRIALGASGGHINISGDQSSVHRIAVDGGLLEQPRQYLNQQNQENRCSTTNFCPPKEERIGLLAAHALYCK